MPRTSVESSEREALGSATQVGLFAAYLSTSARARCAPLGSKACKLPTEVRNRDAARSVSGSASQGK